MMLKTMIGVGYYFSCNGFVLIKIGVRRGAIATPFAALSAVSAQPSPVSEFEFYLPRSQ